MKKIPKNISFETALAELEKQVQNLESGDLNLDRSLEAFAYGTELSRICLSKLNTAKAAVEKLVVPPEDEEAFHTEAFDHDGEFTAEQEQDVKKTAVPKDNLEQELL